MRIIRLLYSVISLISGYAKCAYRNKLLSYELKRLVKGCFETLLEYIIYLEGDFTVRQGIPKQCLLVFRSYVSFEAKLGKVG